MKEEYVKKQENIELEMEKERQNQVKSGEEEGRYLVKNLTNIESCGIGIKEHIHMALEIGGGSDKPKR